LAAAKRNASRAIPSDTPSTSYNTRPGLTRATQEAFNKNVEISGKISKLIDEIAAASQEQAQGISQVGKDVATVAQAGLENVLLATPEQCASWSRFSTCSSRR